MSGLFKVLDPRIDLNKPNRYAIEDGARLVNFEVSNAASSGSGGSSLTFTNSDPPGPGVVIDKKVIIAITYKLTFTRTNAPVGEPVIGYEPLPGFAYPTDQVRALGTDGPRFLPIAQTTNSMTVNINNASANGQIYDYVDPLMRYNASRDYDESQLALAPSMQDQFQDYGDFLVYGSARNVLGSYGENSYESTRGGFPLIWIAQNQLGTGAGTTTAVVYLTSYEPIFVSPCDFGVSNQRGFYGVNTFRLTLNTTGDLTRVWCHNSDSAKGGWALTTANCVIAPNGDTVTYSNGIISGLPALYFTYLTPKILSDVPGLNVYPYYYLDDQAFQDVQTVNSFSNGFYKTNAFKLDSVPKYLYVYVRKSNSTRTYSDTDTYAFIKNLSITFGNASNLLASASANQLYSMSVKNGCKLSWAQWSKYVGSVVCIDFSQDIGLPDDMFVGMRDPNAQLSVQVTWQNISEHNVSYSVYCIPSYSGIFDITQGQAQSFSGIVSLSDYVNSRDIHTLDYTEAHNFYGGSFTDRLRDVGRKAIPALKELARAAPTIAKYAAPVLAPRFAPEIQKSAELIAELVGRGFSQAQAKQMVMEGKVPAKKVKRKKAKGGANVDRTLLARAIGM
jgi:hypothetical protein